MREMLIILRMALVLRQEIDIKAKLLKHRHKMLDIYQKYQDYSFEYRQTKQWRDDLRGALVDANKEMEYWR